VIWGSAFDMLPDNCCGVLEYAGWVTFGFGIRPVLEFEVCEDCLEAVETCESYADSTLPLSNM
jgi:hypothetical protein